MLVLNRNSKEFLISGPANNEDKKPCIRAFKNTHGHLGHVLAYLVLE